MVSSRTVSTAVTPKAAASKVPALPKAEAPSKAGERIAKRIARAGVCSRRDAEKLIAEGRVAVDNVKITSAALDVELTAIVTIDGKPIDAPEPARLWRYNKPRGLVTTHRDPQGRPTLFDHLPADLPRVISIGRLDLNSEGLLLLTNDGGLARRMELPSTGWIRRYRVRVNQSPSPELLAELANGITIEGVRYGAIEALLDSTRGANSWLTLGLREGKNREIRRVIEYLGGQVTRLIRTGYGPFQLGQLAPGQAEEVPARILREQLGLETAVASAEKAARAARKVAKQAATAAASPAESAAPVPPAAPSPGPDRPPRRPSRLAGKLNPGTR